MRHLIDTALRPRRGGPRFVDEDERRRAEQLVADPRTNDQLAFDLIMDVLRAGTLADAPTVLGARQAGVRIARVLHGEADDAPRAYLEEDGGPVPSWVSDQRACDTGRVTMTVDDSGNPLILGREKRLFSAKQRITLAVRDGGCRWRGCDRPPSYCEAHHIDHVADGGRTDVDRGILLCRFHHMQLHQGGWRITRVELEDFVLHPPRGAEPIVLRPRLALQYAWGDVDPPPRRFRPAA